MPSSVGLSGTFAIEVRGYATVFGAPRGLSLRLLEDALLLRGQGADAVFDHIDEDHFGDIREFTGGKGADVIIEMLANENLERDYEAIAIFGRIVIVGNRGSLTFTPRQAMTKETTIYGMSLFNAPAEKLAEIHDAIFTGLSEGYLQPPVSRSFALAEAPAAHHAIMEQKAHGKIVIAPG